MRLGAIVLLITLVLGVLGLREAGPDDVRPAADSVPRHGVGLLHDPPAHLTRPTLRPDVQASTPPAGSWPPRRALLFNDPHRHRHAIADTLVRYIRATPRGATIQVSTYFLGSSRIEVALAQAARRGVHVQVLLTAKTRPQYVAGRRLARALRPIPGSWLRWVPHATRGYTGIDHQKIYRFSQVGPRADVTVLGSYNSAWRSDDEAYALMLEVARPVIYRALATIFAQSERDQVILPNPLRTFAGRGWSLYVLPSFTPEQDPALVRLHRLPGRPSTRIRIAMYAMNGLRARRIARRLETMARSGARITFAAGPGVAGWAVPALRASGVRVVAGCFADGTYTHSKDMSATWVRHGHRTWWTWVGSDNWTDYSDTSDEATLGLRGHALYDDFERDFGALLARRPFPLSRCHPADRAVVRAAPKVRRASPGRARSHRARR